MAEEAWYEIIVGSMEKGCSAKEPLSGVKTNCVLFLRSTHICLY